MVANNQTKEMQKINEKLETLINLLSTSNNNSSEEFLDVKETAELLNVSKSTVYELINQGRIPSCKVGRRKIINKEQLIENIS